jgi:hypothetical protein
MALVAEVSLPDASALPPVEGAVEIALRRTARQWLARVAAVRTRSGHRPGKHPVRAAWPVPREIEAPWRQRVSSRTIPWAAQPARRTGPRHCRPER